MTDTTTIYDALIHAVREHGAFHPLTGKEGTDEYLKRLAKAVAGVTKRIFDDMPEAAQNWFDAAATAIAEKTAVPVPAGFTRGNGDTVKPVKPPTPVLPPVGHQPERRVPRRGTPDQVTAKPPIPAAPPVSTGRIKRPISTPGNGAPPRPLPPRPPQPAQAAQQRPSAAAVPHHGKTAGGPSPAIKTAPAEAIPTGSADEPVSTRIIRMVIADETQEWPDMVARLKAQGVQVSDSTVRITRYSALATLRLIREAGWHPPT